MRICFIDTETTGLDRKRRQVWDFACIVRDLDDNGNLTGHDTEHQFFIGVDLTDADPFALRIGHYWERHPLALPSDPAGKELYEARKAKRLVDDYTAAGMIADLTANAIWVGAVPSFDEETIAKMLRRNGFMPRWDYHLVDVETFAAGYLGMEPPWKNDVINKASGIVIPEADRHTALGDARGVRDLYDKIRANWARATTRPGTR
jgi:DNA polymerase III epsilon subunit-like protein